MSLVVEGEPAIHKGLDLSNGFELVAVLVRLELSLLSITITLFKCAKFSSFVKTKYCGELLCNCQWCKHLILTSVRTK